MSRHITIISAGSRGDTQPYLALAIGLKEAGFEVRLAASENFESFVTDHGLDFAPISGDFQAILPGQMDQFQETTGDSSTSDEGRLRQTIATIRFFGSLRPLIDQMAHDAYAACQGTDAIINALPLIGYDIAQGLGVPYFPASLFPFMPTRDFSFLFMPPAPRPLNRLSYTLADQAAWRLFAASINRLRRNTLGLKPTGLFGPFKAERAARFPTLYGFSPQVIPPPADWPENIHTTGYWLLNTGQEAAFHPPGDLAAFLDSGSPPVFIGFGSMPDSDPQATTELILEALTQAGRRGILLSGWAGLAAADMPPTVFKLDYAPFEWLFSRMSMVIHHGGAGTTGLALRSGVPSMVVPFGGDQLFWGTRVFDLGAGPPPIPRRKLTADRLAEAIQRTLSNETMRQTAADLGQRIHAEDGIARAVEIVSTSLDSHA